MSGEAVKAGFLTWAAVAYWPKPVVSNGLIGCQFGYFWPYVAAKNFGWLHATSLATFKAFPKIYILIIFEQ